ncbi:MAG: threonine--tRNA ligase, partial [Candidatus Magasanikbacteria bacterium]
CAHLLAAAVLEIYPDAKPTIGPPIEDGFYYDFDFGPESISKDDLEQIENKMRELVKDWDKFEHEQVSAEQAREYFQDNKYKQELIDEIEQSGEDITFYSSGDFTDLCRGGHVGSPNEEIGAIKLTDVAGAYWRGDEDNKMLTRIYGTCFNSKDELEEYLEWKQEAEKRDHKKLGKELGLFMFSDQIGAGLPLFTPKGNIVRQEILDYCREKNKECGFSEVHTPNLNKRQLFETSGHIEKFEDGMFEVEPNFSEDEYFLKPMNCPQHTQIYSRKLRSYRDLPIRYSDFANLYRDEKPGEIGGINRTRCFAQDDGHIFCRKDQIRQEYNRTLDAIGSVLSTFDLEYDVVLSLWDPENKDDYLGEDSLWEEAQTQLRNLLEEKDVEYTEEVGEAAFYGPKMDFIVRDALKREWDMSTIQIDLNLPQRFDLEYVDEDGERGTPIMIHRAMVGSMERFMGILIEHYGGEFPVWLSPTQVHFIPVSSEDHIEGTREIAQEFEQEGIRVNIDDSDESVGKRIREAVTDKIPYILVIGDD